MKEAEEYKDEPLKYLAKLQKIKIETEDLRQKSNANELKKITDILSLKLTPTEKLKFSDEFLSLTATERKYIEDKLKSVSKRDIAKRNEIVKSFLDLSSEKRSQLLSGLITEEKPKKGVITEITPEESTVSKKLVKEIKQNTLAETEFLGDLKMKKFVKDKLMGDTSSNKLQIEKNIEMYIKQYEAQQRQPYQFLQEKAEDEAEKQETKEENIDDAVDKSAEIKAIDDGTITIPAETPEEKQMIDNIANDMVVNDGTPEEIAKEDAKQAVEGAKAELNLKSSDEQEPEPEPEKSKRKVVITRRGKDNEYTVDFTPPTYLPANVPYNNLNEYTKILKINHIQSKKNDVGKEFEISDFSVVDTKIGEFLTNIEKIFEEPDKDKRVDDLEKFLKKEKKMAMLSNLTADANSADPINALQLDIRMTPGSLLQKYYEKDSTKKAKGKGFTPLHNFPPEMVAGALGRHINRVRQNRFNQNVRTMNVHMDTNNKEYAHKLRQHLLSGGGFGDWFFTGLRTPFNLMSKIPLVGNIFQPVDSLLGATGAKSLV